MHDLPPLPVSLGSHLLPHFATCRPSDLGSRWTRFCPTCNLCHYIPCMLSPCLLTLCSFPPSCDSACHSPIPYLAVLGLLIVVGGGWCACTYTPSACLLPDTCLPLPCPHYVSPLPYTGTVTSHVSLPRHSTPSPLAHLCLPHLPHTFLPLLFWQTYIPALLLFLPWCVLCLFGICLCSCSV